MIKAITVPSRLRGRMKFCKWLEAANHMGYSQLISDKRKLKEDCDGNKNAGILTLCSENAKEPTNRQ